jgi:hypothetical protein
MTVKMQQAFGGIVAPPTTGDVEHYELVARPSANRLPGGGTATEVFVSSGSRSTSGSK